MNKELPAPIAAYFQAANAHNTDALLETFSAGAIVADESREYLGHEEIRKWSDWTVEEYHASYKVLEVTQAQGETVVRVQVAGTFDGSPIELDFHFTINGDKITALTIR
jgi:hypothetical protein